LSPGVGNLRVMLFSDKSRTVLFQARAVPQAAGKDSARTLVVAQAAEPTRVPVQGEQDVCVRLPLREGLNPIEFSVVGRDGEADGQGDAAGEGTLLLRAPRFTSPP